MSNSQSIARLREFVQELAALLQCQESALRLFSLPATAAGTPHVLDLMDAAADAALLSIFDAGTPAAAIEHLRGALQGLGVATDPAHYGVPPEDWSAMVQKAASGPRGRNFIRALA